MKIPISRSPIFRPDALREYTRGRELSALPTFPSNRRIYALWLILLIMSIGAMAGLAIPITLATRGVIVPELRKTRIVRGDHFVISIASKAATRVRVGQTVFLAGTRAPVPIGRVATLRLQPDSTSRADAVPNGGRIMIAAEALTDFSLDKVSNGVEVELGRYSLWSMLRGGDDAQNGRD